MIPTDIIVNLTKQVNRIDERSERIEDTVNEIDRKLDELAAQINAYQSLVERQIEKADSDIEIDRIIQGYTDECVERIVKATIEENVSLILQIDCCIIVLLLIATELTGHTRCQVLFNW